MWSGRIAVLVAALMLMVGCAAGGSGGLSLKPTSTLRPDGADRAEHLVGKSINEDDARHLAEDVCGKVAASGPGDKKVGAWIIGAMNIRPGQGGNNLRALARVIDAYCPAQHDTAWADLIQFGINLPDTDLTP